MVIVPDMSMVWDQLEGCVGEVVVLDCVETSEEQLAFIRTLRENYPQIRVVLVSAALNKKMESELMEAGVHLCFAKPRTTEEAESVYRLVEALTYSEGFYPNGNFKGLAPARYIQFLCARGETGQVGMYTNDGEAILVLEDGRIVDASLGELRGDAAAAAILALDQTSYCHFKHMLSSQFHTIHLHTHQLWLDSDAMKKVPEVSSTLPRQAPRAKNLLKTMEALAALDRISLPIYLEAPIESGAFFPLPPPVTKEEQS